MHVDDTFGADDQAEGKPLPGAPETGSLQDVWIYNGGLFLERVHNQPRELLFDPSTVDDLPVPLGRLHYERQTLTDSVG